MNRKPRFSLPEHALIGRRLFEIRTELSRITTRTAGALPVKHKANPALSKAIRNLDQARSALENTLFTDYPDQATTRVYYPGKTDQEEKR